MSADQRLLEKAGEPRGNGGTLLHVLQLRSRASDAPGNASDGSWCQRSRLVSRGNRCAPALATTDLRTRTGQGVLT